MRRDDGNSHLRPVDIEPEEDRARRLIREESAALLRSWAAMAEAGELDEVMLVGRVPGGGSTWAVSGSLNVPMQIGMLEVFKHDLIDDCLAEDDD